MLKNFNILKLIILFGVITAKPLKDYCDNEQCNENKPNIKTLPDYSLNKPNPKLLCELCNIAMPVVRSLIDKNKTEHFESIAVFFCNEFKIVDPVVCSLVIKEYEVRLTK